MSDNRLNSKWKDNVGGADKAPPSALLHEIDELWKEFDREKDTIIREEMDSDYRYYIGLNPYVEPDLDPCDYLGDWRVEELRDRYMEYEDLLWEKYGY